MDRVQRLAKVKGKKEEQEQRHNKLSAKLDLIKSSLDKSFGVDSIKEGIEELKSTEQKLKSLTDRFDGTMGKVEDKYDAS